MKCYHTLLLHKTFVLFCGCLFFSSCLKNSDNTANGPKSQVAITNYVVNGSINVVIDNAALTSAPLGFGGSVATAGGGYAPLGAGLHNLQLHSDTSVVVNKTLSVNVGTNYSLFIYDTLKNNKVKTLLLTDDLTVIDTVGRTRFLQFIPGADSLTFTLVKDTITYTFIDGYIGNKTDVATVAFSTAMMPGSYGLTLKRNGATIFQQAGVTITAGKIYSFIARGTVNGTGNYLQSVKVVQHN